MICLLDMSGSNTTQYALLGLLTIEPMSGYDLGKNLRESLNYFWAESNGQIYPTLKKLAAEGLIVAVATQAAGRRARHKYALTPAGRKRLKEWLAKPPQLQPPRNELLLKLFLGRSAPKGAIAEHVARFKRQYEEIQNMFEGLRASLQTEHAESPDLKYWMLCLEHGIRLRQAQIDWCNLALRELATTPQGTRGRRVVPRG
jgi:PadR family transcriptional regulator, regulatory protein AphA